MKTTLKIHKKYYTEKEITTIMQNFMDLVGNSKRDKHWHVELSACSKYYIIRFNLKEDNNEYYKHEEK